MPSGAKNLMVPAFRSVLWVYQHELQVKPAAYRKVGEKEFRTNDGIVHVYRNNSIDHVISALVNTDPHRRYCNRRIGTDSNDSQKWRIRGNPRYFVEE